MLDLIAFFCSCFRGNIKINNHTDLCTAFVFGNSTVHKVGNSFFLLFCRFGFRQHAVHHFLNVCGGKTPLSADCSASKNACPQMVLNGSDGKRGHLCNIFHRIKPFDSWHIKSPLYQK